MKLALLGHIVGYSLRSYISVGVPGKIVYSVFLWSFDKTSVVIWLKFQICFPFSDLIPYVMTFFFLVFFLFRPPECNVLKFWTIFRYINSVLPRPLSYLCIHSFLGSLSGSTSTSWLTIFPHVCYVSHSLIDL